MAILTGLRRQEQFSLKWTDIDLERGLITLKKTKSGNVQYLPLSFDSRMLLKSMPTWHQSTWVFPSKTLGSSLDPFNFYHRIFVPAVRKAGLEDVTWHTLRHTFAIRLAMGGVTERELHEALRHSSTALIKRYAHLSPKPLAGMMERISTFGQPASLPESPNVTGSVILAEESKLV